MIIGVSALLTTDVVNIACVRLLKLNLQWFSHVFSWFFWLVVSSSRRCFDCRKSVQTFKFADRIRALLAELRNRRLESPRTGDDQ